MVGDFNTPLSPKDRLNRQKLNREIIEQMSWTTKWTSIEHSTQTGKNIPSFQHLIQPSLKLTTYSGTKQIAKLKKIGATPCIFSDLHGLKLKFNNKHYSQKAYKHIEIEQRMIKPPLGQGRNKEWN